MPAWFLWNFSPRDVVLVHFWVSQGCACVVKRVGMYEVSGLFTQLTIVLWLGFYQHHFTAVNNDHICTSVIKILYCQWFIFAVFFHCYENQALLRHLFMWETVPVFTFHFILQHLHRTRANKVVTLVKLKKRSK